MNDKLFRRVQLLSNIAIIALTIVVGSTIIRARWLKPAAPIVGAEVGQRLKINVTDPSTKQRTLLLVLKQDCKYCTASADFYRRIASLQNKNFELIAVLPQSNLESQAYLTKIGVSVNRIVQFPLGDLGVRGTPTVILLDSKGFILNIWRGQLKPEVEEDVIKGLSQSAS